MARLTEHKGRKVQRILLVGDPGDGKTAATGYLLNHGQRLFVADFDDKLDVVRKCVAPEFQGNLIYESLVDKVRPDPSTGYPTTAGKPTAFRRFVTLSSKWVDSSTGEDFGAPETWGENDWLVIDSLTSLGRAALLYEQDQKGQMGKKPSGPVTWSVADRVEGVVSMLRSYPINSIMLAHLAPLSSAEDFTMEDPKADEESKEARTEAKLANPNSNKRFPVVTGSKKLPRTIGGYFSAVLHVKKIGSGANTQRVISTVPADDVDISVPTPPKMLKPEYPLDKLWDIIQIIRGTT